MWYSTESLRDLWFKYVFTYSLSSPIHFSDEKSDWVESFFCNYFSNCFLTKIFCCPTLHLLFYPSFSTHLSISVSIYLSIHLSIYLFLSKYVSLFLPLPHLFYFLHSSLHNFLFLVLWYFLYLYLSFSLLLLLSLSLSLSYCSSIFFSLSRLLSLIPSLSLSLSLCYSLSFPLHDSPFRPGIPLAMVLEERAFGAVNLKTNLTGI